MTNLMMKKIFACNQATTKKLAAMFSFLQTRGYKSPYTNNPLYVEEKQFVNSTPLILAELRSLDVKSPYARRYKEMVEYCVAAPSGRGRPLALIYLYRKLTGNKNSWEQDEEIKKVYILGWSIEIAKSCICMMDDWVDEAAERWGRATWHHKQNHDPIVVLDSDFLRETNYMLLEKHFGHDVQKLAQFYKMIRTSIMSTSYGECVQLKEETFQKENIGKLARLKRYTQSSYDDITYWRAAYFTIEFPLLMAFAVVGEKLDSNKMKVIRELVEDVGMISQVDDDHGDAYLDPAKLGKPGMDIRKGAVTSLLLKALEICDSRQRRILEESYGINDDEHEQRVKKVYQELDIERKHKEWIKERYDLIKAKINRNSDELLRDYFTHKLDEALQRNNECYNE